MGTVFPCGVKDIIWARSFLGVDGYSSKSLEAESPSFGAG